MQLFEEPEDALGAGFFEPRGERGVSGDLGDEGGGRGGGWGECGRWVDGRV